MATTDAARTEGGQGGRHRRHATVAAAVVLALVAIVTPFALRGIGGSGAHASLASHVVAPGRTTPDQGRPVADPTTDPALGSQTHLPALLPARAGVGDGTKVRLGDVTTGFLRRTPGGGWQVLVRWDGHLRPVPTRGPVTLGGRPSGPASASWVSDEGLLYTRVALPGSHEFRVYTWDPRGATAYTPPTLVATDLGRVCFNKSFTDFGNCRAPG